MELYSPNLIIHFYSCLLHFFGKKIRVFEKHLTAVHYDFKRRKALIISIEGRNMWNNGVVFREIYFLHQLVNIDWKNYIRSDSSIIKYILKNAGLDPSGVYRC